MKKKNKTAIYTAIFGKKDILLEPKFIPQNSDFVCFTDQPFKSKIWDVRNAPAPLPDDMTRSNRYYKMHPHLLFPEYETSIYIDGNVLVVGDITELIKLYLSKSTHMAGFSHAYYKRIPVTSLREQLEVAAQPERHKKHKESVELMQRQGTSYFTEGFPDTNGFLWTMTLVRRHNEPDVVNAMEAWWSELNTWSKRDQMSFNYIAWKHNFNFSYILLDGSDNKYVKRIGHYIPPRQKAFAYFLGALNRIKFVFSKKHSV